MHNLYTRQPKRNDVELAAGCDLTPQEFHRPDRKGVKQIQVMLTERGRPRIARI